MPLSSTDKVFLHRTIELAREALEAGNDPFGSLLVDSTNNILKEDRNRIHTESNLSLHPEFTLALWAQRNLSAADRATATVYTSGKHCPMCAAAHAYAGLGRIVYASSARQLEGWMEELGAGKGAVSALGIREVAPGLVVDGPAPELGEAVFELHRLRTARVDAGKGDGSV